MAKILPEAKKDLSGFEEEIRNRILNKIQENLEGDISKENIEVIERPSYGAVFHRLKLVDKSLNHRVYFDYKNSELYVFAVRHREYAYSSEDIEEAVRRLQDL